ncbi:MAG TPA: peptidylprolyl isomerase, partial [Petrotogaceae bacterium]|nr:peptidylprolyl isomerase [Petrotogaceae bacterium]
MESLKAVITMENEEKIVVELYEKYAPLTVKNFIDLCRKNFYSGLTFHRIVKGFVIQGGCPNGDGTGGPGYEIKGEFSTNGIN